MRIERSTWCGLLEGYMCSMRSRDEFVRDFQGIALVANIWILLWGGFALCVDLSPPCGPAPGSGLGGAWALLFRYIV